MHGEKGGFSLENSVLSVESLAFWRWSSPLAPRVQARLGDLLPKLGKGKGKTVTFSEESLAVTRTLAKGSRSASCGSAVQLTGGSEGYLTSAVPFPKSEAEHEKTLDSPKLRDRLQTS